MKLTFFYVLKTLAYSVLVSLIVLFIVSPVSCRIGENGIKIITCDSVPQLQELESIDSDQVQITFDRNVRVETVKVYEKDNNDSVLPCDYDKDAYSESIKINLLQPTQIGRTYNFEGIISDENYNALLFNIEMPGFNDKLAELYICEIRNAYSSKTNQCEYVKFYCKKGGNLSGYDFFTAGDGEENHYAFPCMDIDEGEYVIVHLRKMKDSTGQYIQEGMIDETAGNIRESYAVDSMDNGWDLWVENQKSRISPSDIIILRNLETGKILDAVLLADPKKIESGWNSKYSKVVEQLGEANVWKNQDGEISCDMADAFPCNGITSSSVNKVISRKNYEIPSCAGDWNIKNNSRKKAR